MFDLDKWQEIWDTIIANPIRSGMTCFGVFWGIFMLTILVGAGSSLERGMLKNFEGFASNTCFIGTNVTSVPYDGYRKGRSWIMTNRDIDLIKQKVPELEYISPMLWGDSQTNNVVLGRKSTTADVMGVYPDHFKMQTQTVLNGRLFNDFDVQNLNKVALIGETVLENLFAKGTDPIGSYIRVNGIYFQVIGVIRPNSKISIGSDVETSVFMPFSTMQKTFNKGDTIHFMGATAARGVPISVIEDQIKDILKKNHNIAPSDEKAIRGFNIEKEFKIFDYLFLGINITIWIVGIGSLFSGIIGVSNIMLVTVRERTREIGVRRALGAKPLTIVVQIMSESFILTLFAGIGGLLFGSVVLEAVSKSMEGSENSLLLPPYMPFTTAIISLLVLILSGILAGIIPAMRALSIKAIDAIREE